MDGGLRSPCSAPAQVRVCDSWTLLLSQELTGVHLEVTMGDSRSNTERCVGCLQISPRVRAKQDWCSQNNESKNLKQQGAKIIVLSQVEPLATENVSVVLHPCQAALLGDGFISTGFALLKARTRTLSFLPRDCGAHQNNVPCANMSCRGLWKDDNGCKTCQSLISYSQKRDLNFFGRILFVWKDPKPLLPRSLPSLLNPQRAAPWDDRFYF